MLLGAGWVINGDISDSSLPPQQIGTLSVNVHDRKSLVILERVQSPSTLWNASLGRFVVLDHDSPKCVGVFCERPRKFKVWLLFHSGRSARIVAPSLGPSEVMFLVFFAPLTIFPASLVVLLSLSLLGCKSISLPMSLPTTTAATTTTLSLSGPIRFPPAPSVLWLVVSSSSLVATSSMLVPLL